ncbi:hypothetical protein GCM10010844_31800 [Deinococcus radiotolerans]|uniref:Uncharacterized protein n=1 Tax=Deinococcus radiotolerans TaxID=1309407 RepID=A0ABQ2FN88_9DEIO|nr:hypothetical protein GCM10010844_31800 [Deinococcus radiotolerans]
MQTQRVIELAHQLRWDDTDGRRAQAAVADGANLLRLGFAVLSQARLIGREQHLEIVDAGDVRGDGHHRDSPGAQAIYGSVHGVTTDDDDGTPLIRFAGPGGVKVSEVEVTSAHWALRWS